MMDIYLFRHAHVDYRPPAPITAHNPLTPLGHRMAERLARRCDEWELQYLFASTMLRAQQTADAISQRFPSLPRLDMREFEETSITDLAGFPGELPDEDLMVWGEHHYAYANDLMWQRVIAGWDIVLQTMTSQGLERAAIVAHGGSINILLRHFLGEETVRLRTCWFELDWSSASCLRLTSEAGAIKSWVRWVNDARHIEDLRRLLAEV
ncbi:MAG: histidine phosphatase family protein [Chloroflexi bacterium]|nr:histidine phosphatase family protein [Chloroflexota bacterium]